MLAAMLIFYQMDAIRDCDETNGDRFGLLVHKQAPVTIAAILPDLCRLFVCHNTPLFPLSSRMVHNKLHPT